MSDEFDFRPTNASAKRKREYNPNRATPIERALVAMIVVFVVIIFGGFIAEWRFWRLWTTGRRATATIVDKEDRIIGWAFDTSGIGAPLIKTGLHYRFEDHHGNVLQDVHWVRDRGWRFHREDRLPIAYGRLNAKDSMPATFAFHYATDDRWISMQIVVVVGILGFLIAAPLAIYLRKRRIQRWKFLLTVAEQKADEERRDRVQADDAKNEK